MKSRLLKFFCRHSAHLSVLFALFLLSTLSGCTRDDESSFETSKKGGLVSFTASSGDYSQGTKASVSEDPAIIENDISTNEEQDGLSDGEYDSSSDEEIVYQFYHKFPGDDSPEVSEKDSLIQISDTRFSGNVITVIAGEKYYERVDWLPGDKITIAEAVSGKSSEYETKDIESGTGAADRRRRSIAKLSTIATNALHWQTGSANRFVAFYPSLSSLGLTESNLSLESTPSSSYGATISGTFNAIPSVQYCYKEGTSRTYNGVHGSKNETWYEPDMKYAYMAAFKDVPLSDIGKDISLEFSPCFSSVEVKLVKPTSLTSAVTLESAVLRAGSGSEWQIDPSAFLPISISGGDASFQVSSSGIGFAAGTGASQSHEITLYFRNSKTATTNVSPTLSATTPISFTFLLLPVDITQLELDLNLKVGSTSVTNTLQLKTVDASTGEKKWIPLAKGKKLTITNLAIDKTPTTLEVFDAPDVINIYANTDNVAGSAPFAVKSYKTAANGTRTFLNFTATFSTSRSGPWYADNATNMPYDLSKIIYASTDSKLMNTTGRINGSGLWPNCMIFVKGQSSFDKISVSDDVQVRANILRNRPTNGFTKEAPQNLALMDPLTGIQRKPFLRGDGTDRMTIPFQTANCYIIQRGGWYMLPLVYGNAVDYNTSQPWPYGNWESYRNSATNPTYLKNYLNKDVRGLIGEAPDETEFGDISTTHEAVGVWADRSITSSSPAWAFVTFDGVDYGDLRMGDGTLFVPDSIIHQITYGDYALTGIPTYSTYPETKYIRFYVDPAKMREGNIVIALREKSGNHRTIWSWHIWVTAEELSVQQFNLFPQERRNEENALLNVPLGWVRQETYRYPERTFYMKLTQATSGKTKIVKVIQHSTNMIKGYAPYYQWGRKDPLIPGELKTDAQYGSNTQTFSPGAYTLTNGDLTSTGGGSSPNSHIQNPHKQGSSNTTNYLWCLGRTTEALQNDTSNVTRNSWQKSIYDPCPPGLRVPNAYLGFGARTGKSSGSIANNYSKYNIIWEKGSDLYGPGGVYFKRYPSDTEGIFFPALGTRVGGRVSRANRQGCYMTQSEYTSTWTYTDPETGTETLMTDYIVRTFSFGHNQYNTSSSAFVNSVDVLPLGSSNNGVAAPIIPGREVRGKKGLIWRLPTE